MRHSLLALLLIAGAGGCANLEARKVPLDKRLEGRDHHIGGFRYYLSRPYLVVNERICVTKVQEEATLGELQPNPDPASTTPAFILKGMTPTGGTIYYTLDGQTWGHALPEGVAFKATPFEAVQPKAKAKLPDLKGDDKKTPEKKIDDKKPDPAVKEEPKIIPPKKLPDGVTELPAYSTKYRVSQGYAEDTGTAAPALQIIHLPDFEEQMAVKSVNVLSKSKFSLVFADGWQLRLVKGKHDSTEVPVAILDLIRSAISAAADVEEQRLKTRPQPKTKEELAHEVRLTRVLITRCTFIEPGVYRLQKPAEMAEPCSGLGLLGDLGIPLQSDVRVHLLGE